LVYLWISSGKGIIQDMLNEKINEIREFCIKNSKQSNIEKYSKYFTDGFDGYGIDQKVFESQRDLWITDWKKEMFPMVFSLLSGLEIRRPELSKLNKVKLREDGTKRFILKSSCFRNTS